MGCQILEVTTESDTLSAGSSNRRRREIAQLKRILFQLCVPCTTRLSPSKFRLKSIASESSECLWRTCCWVWHPWHVGEDMHVCALHETSCTVIAPSELSQRRLGCYMLQKSTCC